MMPTRRITLPRATFLIPLLMLLLTTEAWACKCRPLSLAEYFKNADDVFIAKILTITPSSEHSIQATFKLEHPSYKGSTNNISALRTKNHSASCGVGFKPGATYLIFSTRDEAKPLLATTHSCAGSRQINVGESANPEIFDGIPQSFLLTELLRLAARTKGIGGVAKEDSIIGLLENSKPLLFAAPSKNSRQVPSALLETRELGYEAAAAIVNEVKGKWFRLRSKDGNAVWTYQENASSFHPLATLLPNRLSYLTQEFAGFLWSDPGAGSVLRVAARKEQHIEVKKTAEIAGSLWLQITVLKNDPCQGEAKSVLASGWIPAWNKEGKLTSWYWSRGC